MAIVRFNARLDGDQDPVFAYIVDPAYRAEWDASVRDVEQISEGPVQLGTRLRMVRRVLFRSVSMTVAVNEIDPVEHTYGETVLDGPFRGTDSLWQVELTGWGSKVSVVTEPHISGGLSRFVLNRVRRDYSRSLEALRLHFKR